MRSYAPASPNGLPPRTSVRVETSTRTTRALRGTTVRARERSNGHNLRRSRMRGSIAFPPLHSCSGSGVQFLPLTLSRKSGLERPRLGWNDEKIFPDVRRCLLRLSIRDVVPFDVSRADPGALQASGLQKTTARVTFRKAHGERYQTRACSRAQARASRSSRLRQR